MVRINADLFIDTNDIFQHIKKKFPKILKIEIKIEQKNLAMIIYMYIIYIIMVNTVNRGMDAS